MNKQKLKKKPWEALKTNHWTGRKCTFCFPKPKEVQKNPQLMLLRSSCCFKQILRWLWRARLVQRALPATINTANQLKEDSTLRTKPVLLNSLCFSCNVLLLHVLNLNANNTLQTSCDRAQMWLMAHKCAGSVGNMKNRVSWPELQLPPDLADTARSHLLASSAACGSLQGDGTANAWPWNECWSHHLRSCRTSASTAGRGIRKGPPAFSTSAV